MSNVLSHYDNSVCMVEAIFSTTFGDCGPASDTSSILTGKEEESCKLMEGTAKRIYLCWQRCRKAAAHDISGNSLCPQSWHSMQTLQVESIQCRGSVVFMHIYLQSPGLHDYLKSQMLPPRLLLQQSC